VKLERVEGLVLHVSALDMLDGTPVLDLKPYVSYADALDDAEGGWLETGLDPQPDFEVVFAPEAERALSYLRERFQVDLREPIRRVLVLGPQRHPYRRIRADGDALVLAVKDFRARFSVDGRRIVVLAIKSGYRPRELVENPDPALNAHRAFVAELGG
jgi:mRNA-degrading endonuclease RelE of RelBE toxin-antitoxin system